MKFGGKGQFVSVTTEGHLNNNTIVVKKLVARLFRTLLSPGIDTLSLSFSEIMTTEHFDCFRKVQSCALNLSLHFIEIFFVENFICSHKVNQLHENLTNY